MKKSLVLIMSFIACSSWAKHYFNVCYYNISDQTAKYNNDGITKKWKNRGSLVGSGEIQAGQSKCFQADDETVFLSHYITFYVNDKWIGIVNPGFSKPYAIGQNATEKHGGKLGNTVDHHGHDQYNLNIFIMSNGNNVLSTSANPNDTNEYISPRIFK